MMFILRKMLLILQKKKLKWTVQIILIMESNSKLNTEMNVEIFTKPNAKFSMLRGMSAAPVFHVRRTKAPAIKENVP